MQEVMRFVLCTGLCAGVMRWAVCKGYALGRGLCARVMRRLMRTTLGCVSCMRVLYFFIGFLSIHHGTKHYYCVYRFQ